MKKIVTEFLHRGAMAAGIGPVILAIVYMLLQKNAAIETLSVNQVCIGIISITALSFIAGGMNVIYQIENLPLMVAILIHGGVLYICYLVTYLLNDWMDLGALSLVVFSAIFIVGYMLIWIIIYSVIKKNTARLNKMLKQKQQNVEDNL